MRLKVIVLGLLAGSACDEPSENFLTGSFVYSTVEGHVSTAIEELVQEFGDCVAQQSKQIENGDAKRGNEYANRYISAFERLRGFGDEGREALAVLMDDPRADVRVMAAAFLLRYSTEKALSVLQREAGAPGIVGFGAQQALERWRDGTWSLDPV